MTSIHGKFRARNWSLWPRTVIMLILVNWMLKDPLFHMEYKLMGVLHKQSNFPFKCFCTLREIFCRQDRHTNGSFAWLVLIWTFLVLYSDVCQYKITTETSLLVLQFQDICYLHAVFQSTLNICFLTFNSSFLIRKNFCVYLCPSAAKMIKYRW